MTAKLDPITLELIYSKVTSVIEEMRIVLFHSGYSTVLRESEDGSAGLLDARLRTVSVSKKLPLHFGSFADSSLLAEESCQFDDDIAEPVDMRRLPGMHHSGRIHLLDDRRSA